MSKKPFLDDDKKKALVQVAAATTGAYIFSKIIQARGKKSKVEDVVVSKKASTSGNAFSVGDKIDYMTEERGWESGEILSDDGDGFYTITTSYETNLRDWPSDAIRLKQVPATSIVEVGLKSNAEDEWGFSINFSSPWRDWEITDVMDDKQAETWGIRVEDRIDGVDDLVLDDNSCDAIKGKLAKGSACTLTLSRKIGYQDVLRFWFKETTPSQRFERDPLFDQKVIKKFGALHQQATENGLAAWREHKLGALAEIIVLDQLSRHIYRDLPAMYAQDEPVLILVQQAVESGYDQDMDELQKTFLYMPYLHSESQEVHAAGVKLYSQPGLESSLKWMMNHKDVIDKFGRFPHRNEILGRVSTEEEIAFLKKNPSGFAKEADESSSANDI